MYGSVKGRTNLNLQSNRYLAKGTLSSNKSSTPIKDLKVRPAFNQSPQKRSLKSKTHLNKSCSQPTVDEAAK